MKQMENTVAQEEFMAVPLSTLQADTATGFDLYLRVEADAQYTLYREKSLPFTNELKRRLVDNGVDELHLPLSQQKEYVKYVESVVGAIMEDNTVDAAERTRIYYDAAEHILRDIFEGTSPNDTVPRCEKLVWAAVSFISREQYSYKCFLKVTGLDYSTYLHAVNAFLYAIHLGQATGMDDLDDIAELGLAALLMDIGKSEIDPTILYQSGPLNDEQWAQMREHPRLGHGMAESLGVTKQHILDVILHHHEKLDGSGYPAGLSGDGMDIDARILGIADIYDALTARDRPYKRAVPHEKARGILEEDAAAGRLDSELVRIFFERNIPRVGRAGDKRPVQVAKSK